MIEINSKTTITIETSYGNASVSVDGVYHHENLEEVITSTFIPCLLAIGYSPDSINEAILNEDETPALTESVSRERDTWIQREFSLNEGEVFKVKIALDEFSLIETFEA